MPISEVCNREVVIVQSSETLQEAAKLMRQHHVGDVVVVEERGGARMPLGIITDRDLVIEVMAPKLNPSAIKAGEVISSELVTIREDAGLFEAIGYMRSKGVRRLPVVSGNGGLVGILTLDDLLELLSEELSELVKLVKYEQKKETMRRP